MLLPYAISVCGLDEIAGFSAMGVSHALSILDPAWPDPPAFCGFNGCQRKLFRFHDVIDEDDGSVAPTVADVARILEWGRDLEGVAVSRLLIHCHAGVSRSTAAAIILLAQANPGAEAEAFAALVRIRPWSWPNSRMIEMADALLDRGGRLTAGLPGHYARMIAAWPDRAMALRDGSRGREYRLAGG